MKRLSLVLAVAGLLVMPASTLAFHHGQLPAEVCSATVAGDPSNTNGGASTTINERNPFGRPLPPARPIGNTSLTEIPGNGQGDGGAHCAGGPID